MKLFRKRIVRALGIFLAGSMIVGGGLISTGFSEDYFEVSRNLDIFSTLFRELNIYYVDDTQPGKLMKKGIDAMLESLDPYTNYIPESAIEDYRFMTTGQYGGIGALIGMRGDDVLITDPYEGFPAFKADLRAGDVITAVDGKPTSGKKTGDVSKVLKGQPNTKVTLTIRRDGVKSEFDKVIVREEIKIKSVPYYGTLNDGKTGYIKLTSFTDKAGKEVKEALVALKNENNVESVILDLRGNPGGLLNESVKICNYFVDRGKEVVSTKGKVKEWDKSYRAIDSPVDTDIPLVVLVNSSSASASEIVSGCMQDLDRGLVIGQKTFGKGLVQTTRPLAYNAQLKVTTAKYYIPSGRCIQALDYGNRNKDGSVGNVPDSLISVFKTSSGREVYDGGGIAPDHVVEQEKLSNISRSLIRKYIIFDYATKFKRENETIAKAMDFKVTDQIYEDFLVFIADKEYDYTNDSEAAIEDFELLAKKDKCFDAISSEYDALKAKVMHSKKEDVKIHKEEIKSLLLNEIISRYYFQNGRIEASFKEDKDIAIAVKAINDKKVWNDIFDRKYKQN